MIKRNTKDINDLETKIWLLIFGVLIFTSCTKNLDDYGPQSTAANSPIPLKERTIIVNEGNYTFGNGSVSIVNNETGNVANDVFKEANMYPIGDVPQSMMIHDSLAYVVVNNSAKIEVVHKADFSSVKTILGFNSPRQMAIIGSFSNIAWVTDLYEDEIYKLDLEKGVITGRIPAPGWNENIVIRNNYAYVLNKTDSVINVYSTDTELKIATIDLGGGIADFKLWNSDELMVVANTGIYTVNMSSNTSDKVYTFSNPRTPLRMAVDTVAEVVYFIEDKVFKYETNKTGSNVEIYTESIVGSNWYGIEINPDNSFVYLMDAKDFVQQGDVVVMDVSGNEVAKYGVGINPQFVVFD